MARENFVELETRPQETPIAVLISNQGSGSNLKALIDANNEKKLHTPIWRVISDKPDAKGLQHAINNNIPYSVRKLEGKNKRERNENRMEYGEKLGKSLNQNGIQIAVLAGFMTILPESYFETFKGATINIHPGWIPDRQDQILFFKDGTPAYWNRGMMTDDAVKQFDHSNYAGSTIHIATPQTDFGPVLERVYTTKTINEDVGSVYDRLKKEEHKGLIRALQNPQRIMRLAGKVT